MQEREEEKTQQQEGGKSYSEHRAGLFLLDVLLKFFLSHEQRAEWGTSSCLRAAIPTACDLVPNPAVCWVKEGWGKAPRGRSLLCWEEAETFCILSGLVLLQFFPLLPDLLHLAGMCVRPLPFAPWHCSVWLKYLFPLQACSAILCFALKCDHLPHFNAGYPLMGQSRPSLTLSTLHGCSSGAPGPSRAEQQSA